VTHSNEEGRKGPSQEEEVSVWPRRTCWRRLDSRKLTAAEEKPRSAEDNLFTWSMAVELTKPYDRRRKSISWDKIECVIARKMRASGLNSPFNAMRNDFLYFDASHPVGEPAPFSRFFSGGDSNYPPFSSASCFPPFFRIWPMLSRRRQQTDGRTDSSLTFTHAHRRRRRKAAEEESVVRCHASILPWHFFPPLSLSAGLIW